MSCQPVVASSGAGERHRLASTTPVAMTTAPPSAASDAERVQPGVRAEDEQADAGDTGRAGDDRARGQPFAEQAGGQAGDEHRLDRADGRGDPAGQPVRGDEQQREERADVEGAEHQRPPPPVAPRQLRVSAVSSRPAGRRADDRREQRAVRRQQLARDQVGRPPDGGGERGDGESIA